MAIIKCKMCGGDIELTADKTFGICDYCGSTMTLPKLDDEQRAAAFNRGNHFRRIGEFDKALAVYERIVQEDDTDAEAHWCCALCRFGIEYVEDPATYEYMPTCHRASFDSFLDDVDYLAAVEHSDGITKRQYQKDAAKIAEVQRGILATSQNAEPFDVFICYKESDEKGERTRDSALAQDIYYQLTEQGRKVFFARITLEDVAGTQYEPYIFAALNSAKVMIVVGTKPEYLNAVWVKNEWSRFLTLMKKDRHKLMIPCYRDMDPYDLPEQLSVLQSYDMAKIGFIQDLTRGIAKVLDADKKPETTVVKETVTVQNSNVVALLKRGAMALEDRDWSRADGFYEEVLNQDAECAEAYLGKALADAHCDTLDDFVTVRLKSKTASQTETKSISENSQHVQNSIEKYTVPGYLGVNELKRQYKFDLTYPSALTPQKLRRKEETDFWRDHRLLSRAIKFADGETAVKLTAARDRIFAELDSEVDKAIANEQSKREAVRKRYEAHLEAADQKAEEWYQVALTSREGDYQAACEKMSLCKTSKEYIIAARPFEQIGDYKDCKDRATECYHMHKKLLAEEERIAAEKKAEEERIAAEKKAEEERIAAEKKAEEERIAAERAKKVKEIAKISAIIVAVGIAIVILVNSVIVPFSMYKHAVSLLEHGQYDDAIAVFESMDGYKDSEDMIMECSYRHGIALMDSGNYLGAIATFMPISDYKDSAKKIEVCNTAIMDEKYNEAIEEMAAGNYSTAIPIFRSISDYKDSSAQIDECKYLHAIELMESGMLENAIATFEQLGNYKDSAVLLEQCRTGSISAGETYVFGSYEQDNDTANGPEPIEWIVVDRDGDRILLITKNAIDCQPYHTSDTNVTWENCSLRHWLNDDFFNTAFTSAEMAAIPTTTILAESNPHYDTNPGNDTEDKVFLLSINDMDKLSFVQAACQVTSYAVSSGAYETTNKNCTWWLRSPGMNPDGAVAVYCGSVEEGGYSVDADSISVRPAMWIDLSALDS